MTSQLLLAPPLSRDEQLEGLLQRRLGNRVRDLRVLVVNGGLILQGRTDTYHARQLAGETALEFSACERVANDIDVR